MVVAVDSILCLQDSKVFGALVHDIEARNVQRCGLVSDGVGARRWRSVGCDGIDQSGQKSAGILITFAIKAQRPFIARLS